MNKIVTHSEETAAGVPAMLEQGSLAVSLARAEVDQQITTARAYPRSIARAVQNITTLATLDEKSAEECIYALPRAGKPIKGPSVRLAEIISSQWGNCRVGARVVHVDRFEKFVEAEGVFHDLETNTATTARVRRRISDKNGKLFQDDMIVVTGNAACAIAKRNAILGAVPKAVWRKAYEAVESVIMGDVKTLTERRGRALAAFAAFGVTPEQVLAALGVGGEDDVGLEHLGTLTAMRASLKNGEATVEEMFPKPDAKGPAPKTMAGKLDALAGEPAHDADTGEITQTPSPSSETATAPGDDAGEAESPVDEHKNADAPPPPRASEQAAGEEAGEVRPSDASDTSAADPLLDKARSKAMQGRQKFNLWFRGLSDADQAALQGHMKSLLAAADATELAQ